VLGRKCKANPEHAERGGPVHFAQWGERTVADCVGGGVPYGRVERPGGKGRSVNWGKIIPQEGKKGGYYITAIRRGKQNGSGHRASELTREKFFRWEERLG